MSGGEESPRVYVKSLTLRGFKSFASATSAGLTPASFLKCAAFSGVCGTWRLN